MAQRQPRFSLSQSQFSRRQKRRPRRPKLAFIHLLLAAAVVITIFYATINGLLYDRLYENGAASQHTPAQNIQNRNEDDRENAPETGKKEEREDSPVMQGYSVVLAYAYAYAISSEMLPLTVKFLASLFRMYTPIEISCILIINQDMNKMRSISSSHGSFFFGPDSHQVQIPVNEVFDPSSSWTPLQRELLEDDSDIINVEMEKERCESYGFGFPSNVTMPLKRRRLFYGALISGDSAEVIKATSMEQYNVFHTVSLIESNTTQNLTPKKWRFFGSEDASKELNWLYQLFGPKTKVSVDFYVSSLNKDQIRNFYELLTEHLQREGHSYRWKFNGMRPDDVAIVGDVDETFTRDFLRALQICDIPKLRAGQNCRSPKIPASTVMFESSPECSWNVVKNWLGNKLCTANHHGECAEGRRWYHPDAMLGECIDQIGDSKIHPPTKRVYLGSHGSRKDSYGHGNEYSLYDSKILDGLNMKGQGPLWFPHDVRQENFMGMLPVVKKDKWKSATGYHFHNFFESGEEIRFKYATYGHPVKNALAQPRLRGVHKDLDMAVRCALGKHTKKAEISFESIPSTSRPIYYLNEETRLARHRVWQDIVRKDEGK